MTFEVGDIVCNRFDRLGFPMEIKAIREDGYCIFKLGEQTMLVHKEQLMLFWRKCSEDRPEPLELPEGSE